MVPGLVVKISQHKYAVFWRNPNSPNVYNFINVTSFLSTQYYVTWDWYQRQTWNKKHYLSSDWGPTKAGKSVYFNVTTFIIEQLFNCVFEDFFIFTSYKDLMDNEWNIKRLQKDHFDELANIIKKIYVWSGLHHFL